LPAYDLSTCAALVGCNNLSHVTIPTCGTQPAESSVVMAFRTKMASEEARKQYRRRGRIVEFCHAWIKSKLGLRQFHVRGLKKVQMEMLWACLTYIEAIGCGRYLAVKPADLVAEFLVNHQPDSARIIKTVTTLFETALKAAKGNHPRVAACGECSALLYAEGRAEAAVEMERLLDEFARAHDVDILCGYPIEGFRSEEERSIFQRICAEHSSVYSQ
jgi:Transposase DDE domain